MKLCLGCHKKKLRTDFFRRSLSKDGRASRCKGCQKKWMKSHLKIETIRERRNQYYKAWREKNPEKVKAYRPKQEQWRRKNRKKVQAAVRKRKYGLLPSNFNTLLRLQKNRCVICGCRFSKIQIPCIDHDHETGKVRGLLCRVCNSGLGKLGDSVDKLLKAVNYLQKSK